MRITANMSADNSLYNIQQGRAKLDRVNEIISSGQNVNRPSDDPISGRLLLEIGDKVRSIDQYSSNISKASSWLKFTSTVLEGGAAILHEARKVAATLNSGSSDPSIRQSAHDQLVELKKQIVDMANTPFGDQYLFGGAKNASPPFIEKTGDLTNGSDTVFSTNVTGLASGMPVSGIGIPTGTVIGAVDSVSIPPSFTLVDSTGTPVAATATATGSALNIYAGDNTQLSIEISQSASQSMNITGDRLLRGDGANPSYGSIDILKTFDNLIAAIGDSTTPSDTAGITQAALDIQDGTKQLNVATSDILSRTTRLDNMRQLNDNIKSTLLSISTKVQEVDYAKRGIELNNQKLAYEASLSATAKLTQLSLLDFLR